ncbi:hypothetical protein HTIA_p2904 (plasmid) [Halorhabdus tiamatea SARL4B]|uniref:Uncharacterized protein n=1 Tax=Halorhabdus tiamatea SARL4B TaxID=1033806 RepID=S6D9D2_9EURY|nr:hypothetical protein HTIA_p2904 [Halorhabdus tiamatea SARL4B]
MSQPFDPGIHRARGGRPLRRSIQRLPVGSSRGRKCTVCAFAPGHHGHPGATV